jgi:hypothetical protein
MTTINTNFNPADLPDWAQQDSAVVERCRVDLRFRVQVCEAQAEQWKNYLRRDTQRWHDAADAR